MQDLLEFFASLALDHHRAMRQLGAIRFRTRSRRWSWLLAVALAVALVGAPFGLLWSILGFVAMLAVAAGIGWLLLAGQIAIGERGIVIQSHFIPWHDVVSCQIARGGSVELRTNANCQRFLIPHDGRQSLECCLEERGIPVEKKALAQDKASPCCPSI